MVPIHSPFLQILQESPPRKASNCRCLKDLEMQIKKVDGQYDLCNEVWAQGEVEGFQGDQFLGFELFVQSLMHTSNMYWKKYCHFCCEPRAWGS